MPAVLVMVGDGPDRVHAEAEARELGVEGRVFFLGKIETVAPLLSAADLFLLPSQSESFGLSALEALASGVPVIGSDAGGIPEVVRDGETGALCAVGDIDGMAAAAIGILADRDRLRAMSSLAARDARARFSLDDVVEQYESFYDLALTARS
jgi:N-acetyl-alpha-D-glucosaminyl L-malate synthase BshA